MARNEKASEKVEKGLTNIPVELSKVRDALYRWKDVAEGLANEEKKKGGGLRQIEGWRRMTDGNVRQKEEEQIGEERRKGRIDRI